MTGATTLYEQANFPVFQNRIYESAQDARACPRGDIRLIQDRRSGLVYNSAFRPELMTYDAAYQNEQAHSPTFKSHLDQVAEIVERNLGREGLVEVGCGKGYFLELLQSRGCSIVGFDPTYEGENVAIHRRNFGQDDAIAVGGMVLRHVLEHVQNPVDFLAELQAANGGGLIYIEVPCLDWILRARAWFDICYEHVNYFRIGDFSRMFGRVVDSGRLFGGQYLYAVADLATLRRPSYHDEHRVDFPDDFLDLTTATTSGHGDVRAAWGASSKGVIYSLLRERSGHPLEMLIDINPAKFGKFVPATGLRVASPDEAMTILAPGTDICVMNANYLPEIHEMTRDRFNLFTVERVED